MKTRMMIGAFAGLILTVAVSVTPRIGAVTAAKCAAEVANGYAGPNCALLAIEYGVSPAMAAGCWARNRNAGYTYVDCLKASRQYMQNPYRNAYQDFQRLWRR
ncbi:MAG: hypothetical protein HY695_23105 [Deltaproteobacteria bacterium]|nr:hypothetical protein [Deltaproteobacteria bacterium]